MRSLKAKKAKLSLLGVAMGFTAAITFSLVSCSTREHKNDDPLVNPTGLKYIKPKSEVPDSFALKTIFFETDSAKLSAEAYKTLRWNADWVKRHPTAGVQIEGHCDKRGSELYNFELGEKRAQAARDYLVKLGVTASRIDVVAYGRREGNDPKVWSQNRRVTFTVIFPEDADPNEVAKVDLERAK